MRTGSTRWGIPGRATLIALLVALLFVAGAVYKWVDDQGNVHYSDKPPPGRESRLVTLTPGPTAEQKAQAEQRLQSIRESAQREATAHEAERAHELQQQAAQDSQNAAAALAVQVCADARVQRMTLDLQVPVYRRGPGGERIFMADADRPAAKKRPGRGNLHLLQCRPGRGGCPAAAVPRTVARPAAGLHRAARRTA